MPYLNMDDNFADHPKVDALSDGAFRLHVAGLCYCAKNTTDGVIPSERVTRLIPRYRATFLRELQDNNLWLPHPEGHTIHDYLDWNRSKAWWDDKRVKDAERKAKWRASHAGLEDGEAS